ncbi:MAG: DUF1385 domain-containing protein [Oscillospiraceae bacterium]|nr:DUF1385 domain-containing protein [Oscillospiraceae bacterium]
MSFKTSIGGQAVMEGIAMKGPRLTCLAVRQPDGTIRTEISETDRNPFKNIPLLRGVAAMFFALKSGYSFIMRSTDIAFPEGEEEDKFDRWLKDHFGEKTNQAIGIFSAVLAGFLSIAMFVLLPTAVTGLLARFLPIDGFKTLIEGILKIAIFLSYISLVSRMKEIKRVFMYHGAEHKTIFCFEAGEDLTVENVRKMKRFHPRCGTSFLFITVLISILIFSFVPWGSTGMRVLYKLLCLPLIMGLSYECIKFAGRSDGILSRILSAPGLWVQRMTVFEPDDDMIEVAIEAMKAVIPEDLSEAEL